MLHEPSPWPPPDPPAPSRFERGCRFVPIAGWLVGLCLRARRCAPNDAVLEAIHDQIKEQLDLRTKADAWPEGSLQHRVAKCLEAAVAREKGLRDVRLHRDDPLFLVCWRPCDDLTLLNFAFALENQVGLRVRLDELAPFLETGRTAADLVDSCCGRIEGPGPLRLSRRG
ncbi:hypothetical protein [Paludisphaera mucosa]|uniref:Uncharacterized protein n=1 Tax=Paludisphaera mucosa TaxID=3030827 RepID=A0ABT6F574_9BACT|nr:hypothetical protein [Paludisphaera mucosa]MDG3002669.1 hypothetical protein [Paludisphaera mucosa]